LAGRRPEGGRKQRTREHVIADLAVNHVERQALLCGYTVERVRHDYAIDLMVQTYTDRGEVENGYLLVQVKATDRVRAVSGGRAVSWRVETADLLYWLHEGMPVILVVYDARCDTAFWAHVQEEFRRQGAAAERQAGDRLTVRLPRDRVLGAAAFRQLAAVKNTAARWDWRALS
jgi:hypothetical protein